MSEKRSGRGGVLAEHLFSALSSACVPATLFVSVSIDKCCLMCGITAVWLGLTSDSRVKRVTRVILIVSCCFMCSGLHARYTDAFQWF